MFVIGLGLSAIIAALVVVIQRKEQPRPRSLRNLLLVCSGLLTGWGAARLAIQFIESGQWGNWEDNMPWMLGVGSFAVLAWLLKPRLSEVVTLWWSCAMGMLTTYGRWESGPGDDGMGALLTAIMSFGATVVVFIMIGAVIVVVENKRLLRQR